MLPPAGLWASGGTVGASAQAPAKASERRRLLFAAQMAQTKQFQQCRCGETELSWPPGVGGGAGGGGRGDGNWCPVHAGLPCGKKGGSTGSMSVPVLT